MIKHSDARNVHIIFSDTFIGYSDGGVFVLQDKVIVLPPKLQETRLLRRMKHVPQLKHKLGRAEFVGGEDLTIWRKHGKDTSESYK